MSGQEHETHFEVKHSASYRVTLRFSNIKESRRNSCRW